MKRVEGRVRRSKETYEALVKLTWVINDSGLNVHVSYKPVENAGYSLKADYAE